MRRNSEPSFNEDKLSKLGFFKSRQLQRDIKKLDALLAGEQFEDGCPVKDNPKEPVLDNRVQDLDEHWRGTAGKITPESEIELTELKPPEKHDSKMDRFLGFLGSQMLYPGPTHFNVRRKKDEQ